MGRRGYGAEHLLGTASAPGGGGKAGFVRQSEVRSFLSELYFFNDEGLSLPGGIPFSSQGIKRHIFSFGQTPRGLGLGVLFL